MDIICYQDHFLYGLGYFWAYDAMSKKYIKKSRGPRWWRSG